MKDFNMKIGTSSNSDRGFTGVEIVTKNDTTVETFVVNGKVIKSVLSGMLSDREYMAIQNELDVVKKGLMSKIQEVKKDKSVMHLYNGKVKLIAAEDTSVMIPVNNPNYDGGGGCA